ncbi:MAG: hypothetical protein GX028_08605, partial [Clostridiaceae bacterium]|nr:hypothetical protein [Clostridiaceae bacterium]
MAAAIALNEIYAIAFYAAALLSVIVGAYVYVLNSSNKLNRLFWFISLSLGIWAFSYSMVSTSSSYGAALVWNRASSFGWGLIYSLLLHYFLTLSGRDKFLSHFYSYLLIYIPALVVVYVFGINGSIASAEFELVQTLAGWANVSADSFFDWFFYLYYVIFSLLSVLVLWAWQRKTDDKRARKTVLIISISLAASLSIGGLTDVLFRSSLQELRPQLGVIYALFPVFAVLYSVKKHGIMRSSYAIIDTKPGRVLAFEKRAGFYSILATVLIAGSCLYLLVDFLVLKNSLN